MPDDSDQSREETPLERITRARNEAAKNADPSQAVGSRIRAEYPRSSRNYTSDRDSAELEELRAIRGLLERIVDILEVDR